MSNDNLVNKYANFIRGQIQEEIKKGVIITEAKARKSGETYGNDDQHQALNNHNTKDANGNKSTITHTSFEGGDEGFVHGRVNGKKFVFHYEPDHSNVDRAKGAYHATVKGIVRDYGNKPNEHGYGGGMEHLSPEEQHTVAHHVASTLHELTPEK